MLFACCNALDDPAGHGADIGSPVAANLGFVADTAHGGTDKVPAHGSGDGTAEGGLADSRWADKTEDRSLAIRLQLADREKLDDPLFDAIEIVVVLVEDSPRRRDVDGVVGRRLPG